MMRTRNRPRIGFIDVHWHPNLRSSQWQRTRDAQRVRCKGPLLDRDAVSALSTLCRFPVVDRSRSSPASTHSRLQASINCMA